MKITAEELINCIRQNFDYLQIPSLVTVGMGDKQYSGKDAIEISDAVHKQTKLEVCGKFYRETFKCSVFTVKHPTRYNGAHDLDFEWISTLIPYMSRQDRQNVGDYVNTLLTNAKISLKARGYSSEEINNHRDVIKLNQILEMLRAHRQTPSHKRK